MHYAVFYFLNEKKAAELAFKTVTSSFGRISHVRKRTGQSFSPIENWQVANESASSELLLI